MLEGDAGTIRLLVTDVVLPGRSGRELAAKLAMTAPGVPVILCSGYTGRLVTQAGRLPQDARFLQKPYDAAGLLEQVRAALDGVPAPARA